MQTLHIIENIDNSYGGPAKSVPFLIKYLNKIDINNKIISIKLKNLETNDICQNSGIEILSAKHEGPPVFRYSSKFCQKIESELNNKTIIHTHSLWNYPPYCAYRLSLKHKVPLIVSIRGNLYDWNLKKSRWKKRVALKLFQMDMFKKAACLHATEENELKAIRKLGIKTPVALIPNGIEMSEFKSLQDKLRARDYLKIDLKKKYILFMSRIYSKKGLEFLVQAFLKLYEEYPEWELLIAGPIYDQKYFDRINRMIKQKNATGKIHFFGMVSGQKRLNLFAAANLFVLPAHTENFGMVIGEAMAAKLPVITTTGTPWKVLEERQCGWWIALSHRNIYTALEEAMGKSEYELRSMGEKSYEIVKNNFSWEEVAFKMKEVYLWALGSATKPEWVFVD